MAKVPIYTIQGKDAHANIDLEMMANTTVGIKISYEFAGRDVEEELSHEIMNKIGGLSPFSCFDLLGLSFETDGMEIKGMIGAGSGNIRFIVHPSDWNAALATFAP